MRATFSGAAALGANAQAELKRCKLLSLRGAKVRVPLDTEPSYFEIDFDLGEMHLDGEIEMRGSKALPRDRVTSSTRTEGGRSEVSPRHERSAEVEGSFGSPDRDRESKVNRLHAGSPEEQQRWVGELCAVPPARLQGPPPLRPHPPRPPAAHHLPPRLPLIYR